MKLIAVGAILGTSAPPVSVTARQDQSSVLCAPDAEHRLHIERRVRKIIAEQLGVDERSVTLNANFVRDLGADSLDTIELVMAMEEEFGIEITDEVAKSIDTMRRAVEHICPRIGLEKPKGPQKAPERPKRAVPSKT